MNIEESSAIFRGNRGSELPAPTRLPITTTNSRNSNLKTLLATGAVITLIAVGILLCAKPDIIHVAPLAARVTGISILSFTIGGFIFYFLTAPSSQSPHRDKSKNAQLIEFAKRCTKNPDILNHIKTLTPEDTDIVYHQCNQLRMQGIFNPDTPNSSIFYMERYGRNVFVNIKLDHEIAQKLKLPKNEMLVLMAGVCTEIYAAICFLNKGKATGFLIIPSLIPLNRKNTITLSPDIPLVLTVEAATKEGFERINAENILDDGQTILDLAKQRLEAHN